MSEETLRTNLIQKMSAWDLAIKAGHGHQVTAELAELSRQLIPRSMVCELCEIARRVQKNLLILGWLKPYVRPFDEIDPGSSLQERTLYSSALMRIGAHFESTEILNQISDQDNPQVLQARAHLEIFQWNYRKAIPILNRYLSRLDPESYPYLVGLLNLAAAHVSELDGLKALPLLAKLTERAKQDQHWLIYANSLELSAQVAIQKKDYPRAESLLIEASLHLKGSGTNYETFVEKWRAVLSLLKDPFATSALERLEKFRLENLKMKRWETVRDLDFYRALAQRDDQLFLQVYFGSRFSSYRQRIRTLYRPTFSLPKENIWQGPHLQRSSALEPETEPVPLVDLETGVITKTEVSLGQFPTLLAALNLLTKDTYRPFSLGQIMETLYPNERFNSVSSPRRVYQTIYRLRSWLREHRVPLDIGVEEGEFQLFRQGPVIMKITQQKRSRLEVDHRLLTFLKAKANDSKEIFTRKEFQEKLALCERSAQRILQQGVSEGVLQCQRSGKASVFRAA